jgi:hypothetical protein
MQGAGHRLIGIAAVNTISTLPTQQIDYGLITLAVASYCLHKLKWLGRKMSYATHVIVCIDIVISSVLWLKVLYCDCL